MASNSAISPGVAKGLHSAWRRVQGRARSAWRPRHLYLFGQADAPQAWDEVGAAFRQWCDAHEGEAWSVGLCGRWLLNSVAMPDMDAASARQHAVAQWAHYHDVDEAGLSAEWLVRQLDLPGVHLLCAAPHTLIEGLRGEAVQHGIRLDWVGPWWARGVQAWLAEPVAKHLNQLRELRLWEPGLLTHVQASSDAKGRAALQCIWSEVASRSARSPVAHVALPAASFTLGETQAYTMHVWDQASMHDVLQGRDPAWQEGRA